MQEQPAANGAFEPNPDMPGVGVSGISIGNDPINVPPGDQRPDPYADNGGKPPDRPQPANAASEQSENIAHVVMNESLAGLMAVTSGNGNLILNLAQAAAHAVREDLDKFLSVEELQLYDRRYKSVDIAVTASYVGVLLSRRILVLSCYDELIALNVARHIAYEATVASRQLVTLDKDGQGAYNFRNFIHSLGRSHNKRKDPNRSTGEVCVWAAHKISEIELSGEILKSLLCAANADLDNHKSILARHGLSLICVVSPNLIQSLEGTVAAALPTWEIDFLLPLLEQSEVPEYQALAETVIRQRQLGQWSKDNARFYSEILRHLEAKDLPEIVSNPPKPQTDEDLNEGQLFSQGDPIVKAALYWATYFPNLSPRDFSYLIEMFLGDATEEVSRPVARPQSPDHTEVTNIVESVPLVRRWRRETDDILRRCRLAAVINEEKRRVIDFPVESLRNRLKHLIQNDHYFFYDTSFDLVRRQGLLFSPQKEIAEGARQLLAEIATQYNPNEVVNWLYEILTEFDEVTVAAELLSDRSQIFHLLPDGRVKAARRYVCHRLSLVINRLNKEPQLQDVTGRFWVKLLQTRHQWFLDLLRRMGNFTPKETLGWLKQLLDQGTEDIRRQASDYLVSYLLHRDSVYDTLKELMQWSPATRAGREVREILIVYLLGTNRQLAQQDYGQWPSSHPLFNFQRLDEASESIVLLVGWLLEVTNDVNAMLMIGDIVAGWYFVLFASSPSPSATSLDEDESPLDAAHVRNLLLAELARQMSRLQRGSLLGVWEDFMNDIRDEVLRLEAVAGFWLDAQLIAEAAAARRKLMDTLSLLSQLRRDLMHCAEANIA